MDMKKIKKLALPAIIILLLLILPVLPEETTPRPASLKDPDKLLENYAFSRAEPVEERVRNAPSIVMNYLKNLDKRDDYSPHVLTGEERRLVNESLKLLPPGIVKAMEDRLIGIYFINNFLGNGLADWVLDRESRFYVYLVFNPSVLKKNITRTVTDKEKTCFIVNDPAYDIQLDCGTGLSGFYYILLHETAHLVDYVSEVTPYTEEDVKVYKKRVLPTTPFVAGVWKNHDETSVEYPFRKEVTFYGFNKGPKINITRAPEIYRVLETTSITSLYGTLNWAEDMVEMLTFYHLTEKLKQPFIIKVLKNGREIYRYEPMKNPLVRKRLHHLEIFYK